MSVAVMGVGLCGAFPTSGGFSYRELIARAATMAYDDAGITPEHVEGAVSVEEDFVSGYSIADEYVPDQLGMVRKPVYTVCGDFLHGLCSAVMQIETGRFNTVVVEAYSKASNMLTKDELLLFAFDPTWNRLGVTPHYLAGIEMQRFLGVSDWTVEDVADVVVQNRGKALGNPLSPFGARVVLDDVLGGRPVATPVVDMMFPRHCDASVVVVLGNAEAAKSHAKAPVWISGTGWASGNSVLERREHELSLGSAMASHMAYQEARVVNPAEDIDLFYVSDLYAHRQLMHMDALQLTSNELPYVNPDGGSLGMGDLMEANGGARLFDAVRQLRGEAGAHQFDDVERVLVHGWRGLPTDSSAVVILDAEGRQS